MNADQSIESKKRQAIESASKQDMIPLAILDRLIKERNIYAKEGEIESVEYLNKEICNLLGIPH